MRDTIKHLFLSAAQKFCLSHNDIAFSDNKDGSTSVSVVIRNYPDDGARRRIPLCRFDDNSMTVSASYVKGFSLPADCTSKSLPAPPHPYKLEWEALCPSPGIEELPQKIVGCFLSEYAPASFGCCHRYVACSDAKKCLHPDLLYAKGCMYRRNLESGRIFYGTKD